MQTPSPHTIAVDYNLELRPLADADAEALFALTDRNRAYIGEYLPWVESTKTAADSLEFIHVCQQNWQKGTAAAFGLFWEGSVVGTIGIKDIEAGHQGEIGYWLSQDMSGRGIMTRAAEALVNYGFAELGLERLLIRARAGNAPSAAVALRLGFTHEGTERGGEKHNGKLHDMERYSLLAA